MRQTTGKTRPALSEFVCAAIIVLGVQSASIADPSDASDPSAGPMLRIDWRRGPDLPQGFQDSAGGVVDGFLLTVGGFCAGRDDDKKPGRYPRGFLAKVWALNLGDEDSGWSELPSFPGSPRQGMVAACVENALYCWGGFNYSAPYVYADGACLVRENRIWIWREAPALPHAVGGASICHVGSRIYVVGGALYDSEAFFTAKAPAGDTQPVGAQLLVFETSSPESGWRRLTPCPGTPRWVAAIAAVDGRLYLLGGATGTPYATVVDNWTYDPARDLWSRLPDLPVSSGNFPSGEIVFQDRYILLVGGFAYSRVANPDGSTRDSYGRPGRFQNKGEYYNDVFVFDTRSKGFGRADSLPLNNNAPMTVLNGATLYLIGGETGGSIVEGMFYGHHPELCLEGRLRESSR